MRKEDRVKLEQAYSSAGAYGVSKELTQFSLNERYKPVIELGIHPSWSVDWRKHGGARRPPTFTRDDDKMSVEVYEETIRENARPFQLQDTGLEVSRNPSLAAGKTRSMHIQESLALGIARTWRSGDGSLDMDDSVFPKLLEDSYVNGERVLKYMWGQRIHTVKFYE